MTDRPLWQLLLDLKTAVRGERPFSCEECFTVLAYLAESLKESFPPRRQALLQQAVRQHLDICPNCRAHYLARLEEMERVFNQLIGENHNL